MSLLDRFTGLFVREPGPLTDAEAEHDPDMTDPQTSEADPDDKAGLNDLPEDGYEMGQGH